MAWVPEGNRVPTSIGNIVITLKDTDIAQTVAFTVRVLDQDDVMMRDLQGNLAPHLAPAQITALQDFMADMRAKAVAEILP